MNIAKTVDVLLKEFRRDVPDYLASGIVDMSTGMLLAVDTVDSHPQEILELLAATTADLFQGKAVTQIEDLWKQTRGVTASGHYFQEILINSENLVHLFMRSKANSDIAAVVVCSRHVNIGMLFAQGRQVFRRLDSME
jgi:predicted regulator of Ras-like GTPase activity (Roadblock/LC7/MglB family)